MKKQSKHSEETKRKISESLKKQYKKGNRKHLREKFRKVMMGNTRGFVKGKYAGEKHYKWKGKKCGYHNLHRWVRFHKGRVKNYICKDCKKNQAEHWANIDHKYNRKLEDFIPLCSECHKKLNKQIRNK